MTTPLRLTRIGDSTGTILPNEMLAHMKVHEGDTLYAIETADGYLIVARNPSNDEELEAGREFMKEYSATFQALAK